jgi:hypothetical protein
MFDFLRSMEYRITDHCWNSMTYLYNDRPLKIVSSQTNHWIDSEQNANISFDIYYSLSDYDQKLKSWSQVKIGSTARAFEPPDTNNRLIVNMHDIENVNHWEIIMRVNVVSIGMIFSQGIAIAL